MIDKKSGHPRFYELLNKMAEIYSSKNSDYAMGEPLGNFLECERFGIEPFDGILARLTDKYRRIASLNKKRKAGIEPMIVGEKITDTLFDQAVYSILGILIYEETTRKNDANRK